MPEGRLHLEIGNMAMRTTVLLDDQPLFPQRLEIVVGAGQRTQVLMDIPKPFMWPILCEVMDATTLLHTPPGDYVLVSSQLFAQMQSVYHEYLAMRKRLTRYEEI